MPGETIIGHNNPPEAIELASGVISTISEHMADNPVVEDEETARAMKLQIDRAKICIKDIEAELDGKVRPLNYKIGVFREQYRPKRRMLGDLLDEMLGRVQLYVKREEIKREQAAAEARVKAKLAEQHAKEMERIERERLDDAAKGEVGVNVAEVISQADQAFETYEKAERAAILAQKETHVKVGGGLGRAIGLRKKETLYIKNIVDTLGVIGITPDIEAAVLKSARAYRIVHGELPPGIVSKIEEHL